MPLALVVTMVVTVMQGEVCNKKEGLDTRVLLVQNCQRPSATDPIIQSLIASMLMCATQAVSISKV